MQAEMHEWLIEAETTLARTDERRPEIDRMRAETEVILAPLALHRRITLEEWEQQKAEHAWQIADKERQIAEANQELARMRLRRPCVKTHGY